MSRFPRPVATALAALWLVAIPIAPLPAQDGAAAADSILASEQFVAPPAAIVDAVLAPRHRNVALGEPSPDRRWFIREVDDGPIGMAVLAKPFDELGGLFVDARANRNRMLTLRSSAGLELIGTNGETVAVKTPSGTRISDAGWSADGTLVSFLVHTDDATHAWVAEAATGRARQVTRTPLLATLVQGVEWTPDSKGLFVVLIPANRAARPVDVATPAGPQVKLAMEKDKNHLRTYASLLATPFDQALLEWHATGQLARVDVASRDVTTLGPPAMIREVDASPDGRYVRVRRMTKPFSYIVPVNNFSSVDEVWDRTGRVLATIKTDPINLGVDTLRTPTAPGVGGDDERGPGKRELAWREDGRGLTWLEQEPAPKTDSAVPAADSARRKDRLMLWKPPFDSTSLEVVYTSDTRLSRHRFSPDHTLLFVVEQSRGTVHEYAVDPREPGRRYTLARYKADDVYANPGELVAAKGPMPDLSPFARFFRRRDGGQVVQLSPDGGHAYYSGTAYHRDPLVNGPRSFIDRIEIRTGRKERVYESDNQNVWERAVAFHDLDTRLLVVSRESSTEVPQFFLREGDRLTQLTRNQDYTPDVTSAPRESFVVERPDGFRFKVNVTMPPGWTPGTRLPAMFWFYPREYAGQEEYDRGARTFNKNAFPSYGTRSIQYLVRLGYAVVEPDAPIVGPNRQYNNNYENDLRNNLAAAIDEVDRRGFVDRSRLAIGGHSYGAFSTVNAMVHTPFFKAGIAGDGNYNRTLTPLNFQNERRDLWDARETYLAMSPFLYANHLTGALLLYHGMDDQNVGTDPTHSPRLFHALNGLGKEVSMYLYPYEDHGPATRETLLDLWARWAAWLEKYLKQPGKAAGVSD